MKSLWVLFMSEGVMESDADRQVHDVDVVWALTQYEKLWDVSAVGALIVN